MAITDRAKVQRLMRLAPGYWYQCDGQGLKRLAAAGLGWLERHYETVNALNVFPVPDGDTGINMLLTMRNAWSEIVNSAEDDVGAIASMLAKGAVMGSRGNSGVILSQLWLGFASGVEGMDTFDANGMAQAFRSASESADNVRGMKPVEGTILTVDAGIAGEEWRLRAQRSGSRGLRRTRPGFHPGRDAALPEWQID
jgi:dihydroxyacetone kinase-like predicted kinase